MKKYIIVGVLTLTIIVLTYFITKNSDVEYSTGLLIFIIIHLIEKDLRKHYD